MEDAGIPIDQQADKEMHENGTHKEMPENETVVEDVEETLLEPKLGMTFANIDEIHDYWIKYGNQEGFPIKRRSTTNGDDGKPKYISFACARSGLPKKSSQNAFQMQPSTKTNCKVIIRATLGIDERWRMSTIFLEHNHILSPDKSRYYPINRVISRCVKRRLEMNARAGIRPNKNYTAAVVDAGGPENVSFLEKDCRNHLQSLKLKEGDAMAIQKYFLEMHADNPDFFSMMDLDDDSRIKNIFWADARSRSSYEEFGDVITFDSTYLTNKYDMPFAPFVGVNDHGQSILLGCALISKEDTATFTWVFKTWLECMGGRAPAAIITDQDRAMQNAIEIVFPNTRHRWCLWHILKKLPVKLGSHQHYKSIKFLMKQAIYQSLEIAEFETKWQNFVTKYELEKNEWLTSLYEERRRWVPVFVKDTFWAGMSTTQRSESMNSFFDEYVISTTTLKQFVEQYENALRSKVEKEKLEDFNSFNAQLPCITHYMMERQMQAVYTRSKFKDFQVELTGKMYCTISSEKIDCGIKEYEVVEDMVVGEKSRDVTFLVRLEPNESDIKCNCRLFEFRGIICRHIILVLMRNKIQEVPEKYILRRWRKDVKRCHSKIKISYSNWIQNPENERYDRMCNHFLPIADLATGNEDNTVLVLEWIKRLNEELLKTVGGCEVVQPTSLPPDSAISDVNPADTEDAIIHSPLEVQTKGRRRSIRLKGIEEVVAKPVVTKRGRPKKNNTDEVVGSKAKRGEKTTDEVAGSKAKKAKKTTDGVAGSKAKRGKKTTTGESVDAICLEKDPEGFTIMDQGCVLESIIEYIPQGEKDLNNDSIVIENGGTQESIIENILHTSRVNGYDDPFNLSWDIFSVTNDPTVGSSIGNSYQDYHYPSQAANNASGSFLSQMLDPSDDENDQ